MPQKGQLTTSDPLKGPEFQRLLACLHEDGEYKWELYARLSFCTACRSGDVRNFRWKDVLNNNKIVVREHKTGKVREIPVHNAVSNKIKLLYELLDEPDIESYIFGSERNPEKPISIQYVNRILKDIKKKYNVKAEHFSTHSFRKTFGRFVYDGPGDKSENLIKLNVILKHSSLEVTKRYIGITHDEIDEVFSSIIV